MGIMFDTGCKLVRLPVVDRLCQSTIKLNSTVRGSQECFKKMNNFLKNKNKIYDIALALDAIGVKDLHILSQLVQQWLILSFFAFDFTIEPALSSKQRNILSAERFSLTDDCSRHNFLSEFWLSEFSLLQQTYHQSLLLDVSSSAPSPWFHRQQLLGHANSWVQYWQLSRVSHPLGDQVHCGISLQRNLRFDKI